MNIDAHIAHATAVIGNAMRINELIAKREERKSELAAIEEELTELLTAGQQSLPLDPPKRAITCSKCGQPGHSARKCTATTGDDNGRT
jgi:hypothetical protein